MIEDNSNLITWESSYNKENISSLEMDIIPGHTLPYIIEVTFYNDKNEIADFLHRYPF